MKNYVLTVLIIAILSIGFMAVGHQSDSYTKRRQRDVGKRLELFEACMQKNNYDYTDALCQVCWDSTLLIRPYTRIERQENRRHQREMIKWKRKTNR